MYALNAFFIFLYIIRNGTVFSVGKRNGVHAPSLRFRLSAEIATARSAKLVTKIRQKIKEQMTFF